MENGYFHSPTWGKLSLKEVRTRILTFMENDPQSRYTIVIGSDSAPKEGESLDFITAVVIHRTGKGGIYFWKRIEKQKNYLINGFKKGVSNKKLSLSRLRARIYEEASISLQTANEFLDSVKNDGISKFDVEIHVDIGKYGETRDMITEVVGMIRGSGFNVKTKPESYGASKIADRYT